MAGHTLFSLASLASLAVISADNSQCTSYGFNDNDPPSAEIAYPRGDGFPTLHDKATEGRGSYSDPITFAGAKDDFAIGSMVYVPYLRKYFIMEDYCAQCVDDWQQGKRHIDLWMGPNSGSQDWSLLGPCEGYITRASQSVIRDPDHDLPVEPTPLFNGTYCTAQVFDQQPALFKPAAREAVNAPAGPLSSFFMAPYAASSAGQAPAVADLAIYFWGMPPSSWIQFVAADPEAYTVETLLPGSYTQKLLNLGGGGTSWDNNAIADAMTFIPTIKQLGFDGVCFDVEVVAASPADFSMDKFLAMFTTAKQANLTTLLTSTAEGPYSGCDSPNDCWADIRWTDIDFMVPQLYGPSGDNYPHDELQNYTSFWKRGGGQGVHGSFPGPTDLTKLLWAVKVGTGASVFSDNPFAGGFVEWAFKSL